MAPHRLPLVHRIVGHLNATVVAEHLIVSALVEITSSALRVPVAPRLVLALVCLLGHWHLHLRRR